MLEETCSSLPDTRLGVLEASLGTGVFNLFEIYIFLKFLGVFAIVLLQKMHINMVSWRKF